MAFLMFYNYGSIHIYLYIVILITHFTTWQRFCFIVKD